MDQKNSVFGYFSRWDKVKRLKVSMFSGLIFTSYIFEALTKACEEKKSILLLELSGGKFFNKKKSKLPIIMWLTCLLSFFSIFFAKRKSVGTEQMESTKFLRTFNLVAYSLRIWLAKTETITASNKAQKMKFSIKDISS